MQIAVTSPESMETLGARLAGAAFAGMQVHLSGELGAGKTTLVRGFLRGLGYTGTVKSPTYTLVESYTLPGFTLYHFDFYRVKQANEIDAIGFRDYRADGAICLIEWPEMAGNRIGQPDIGLRFAIHDDGRTVELVSYTGQGNLLISKLGWQADASL